MPKRSNDFQKLILCLQKHKLPNTQITESKGLLDKLTGEEREVDIYIETSVGDHKVNISIECSDKSRPADVGWIETMKAKHEKLDTNKLILVTKIGFTGQAVKLADKYGFQLYKFTELTESEDFPNDLKSLAIKTFTYSIETVNFLLKKQNGDNVNLKVNHDNSIFDRDSNQVGQATDIVNQIMQDQGIIVQVLKDGTIEHKYFVIEWSNKNEAPIFLQEIVKKELEQIMLISIKGKIDFIISKFGTKTGRIGDSKVLWGKTQLATKDIFILGTKESDQTKFSIFQE